jgi:hypothetical protein
MANATLMVYRAGEAELRFVLQLGQAGAVMQARTCLDAELRRNITGCLASFAECLRGFHDDEPRFAQLGRVIFQRLIPPAMREPIKRIADSLVILTDDPSLPWEVLHDGADFLAMRLQLARQLMVSEQMGGLLRSPIAEESSGQAFALGARRIGELALEFVVEYARKAKDIPVAHLNPLFRRLLESQNDGRTLSSCWSDPRATVARWVQEGSDVEKPGHMRLAYLYATELGKRPDEIVELGTQKTLEDMAAELLREKGISAEEAQKHFGRVLELRGKTGKKRMIDSFAASEQVSNWLESVKNCVASAERKQVNEGLQLVFEIPGVHRTLSFVAVDCLDTPPYRVVDSYRDLTLAEMAGDLAAEWSKTQIGRLSPHVPERVAKDTLSMYLNHHRGVLPEKVVERWCIELRTELKKKALPILFAWRYQLLAQDYVGKRVEHVAETGGRER